MFVSEVKWVRIFDIPETSKHKKGFTVYKVISMLYPENCPDAVTKITVWKRFNDFKSLHKDIKMLHKSLKINNSVPLLPTASYFKRFDEDVIQERKELILGLLEYISLHSQLFTSSIFVKFFETSLNPNDGDILGDESDDNCTISDDTDSLSTVSSSMIQLSDDTTKLDEYPICFKLLMGDLQLYSCELFGNSLGSDLIESEYISHADCFFDLAAEIESTHREFKVAWKHYMQGIYILLRYGKSDRNVDRKLAAKFKLEKYFIRIERLFYLNLYEDIKAFIVDNYGEPFANVALADLNNLHFEQLFDLHAFQPTAQTTTTPAGSELLLHADIGQISLLRYQIGMTPGGSVLYDAEDFLLLANKFENEQNYAAAYVNYKMAFSDVRHSTKYLKNERKDLTYLLHNEKYVYRGDELLTTDKEQKDPEELTTNLRRHKHRELYKYKVLNVFDNDTMLVANGNNDGTFLVRIVQKTVAFACDSMIFPKHVPYMTKLQRWHHTEDAVFLIFNYTKAISLKEYLLTLSNSTTPGEKSLPLQDEQNSICTEDFEFLDIPESPQSSGLEESDEFDLSDELIQRWVPIEKVRKWIAQIILAFERLHKCGVYCCELSIDDLHIDENEDILIDYKCKIGDRKIYSYKEHSNKMAPEVYTFELVTPTSDWWSIGVILYEILTGSTLSSLNLDGFYSYSTIRLPKYIPHDAKSLTKQLLATEPNNRLGNAGAEQLKSHPFFNSIKWQSL